MRERESRITLAVLTTLIVLACSRDVRVLTTNGLELNSGNCAGCLMITGDSLFSFVVRTEADFESLTANCFRERIRQEWFPPKPGAEEQLVYVSLKGSGCEGCLDIVRVRETSRSIVVEVEGGFQGNCDKLVVPGAWALIPMTDKPITFELRDVVCPDDL